MEKWGFFSFSDIHVIGDEKVFKDAIEEEQDNNMTMKEWRVVTTINMDSSIRHRSSQLLSHFLLLSHTDHRQGKDDIRQLLLQQAGAELGQAQTHVGFVHTGVT